MHRALQSNPASRETADPTAAVPPPHPLPAPSGDLVARQMCDAIQSVPFTQMCSFAHALARDLGHGDGDRDVMRVARALVDTAMVWSAPE